METIDDEKTQEIKALSGYELANIIKAASDYIDKNKFSFYSDVEENVKYSLGYLIKTVEIAHEAHKKAMHEHYVRLEDSYMEFDKKRSELLKKIKDVEPIKFPDVPYVNIDGLQRLVDMAEKLSSLKGDQWDKLLALAESLKSK